MKKLIYIALGLVAISSLFSSCKDDEITYAEQKEREAKQVRDWLDSHDIDVITLADFLKDTITNNSETGPDTTRNEYVLFEDNGVYMQIVRRGNGKKVIGSDETWYYNARYSEAYLGTGDTMTMNNFQQDPDVFYVKRTGGNYTASFTSGVMCNTYGTPVPSAWIMTIPFIKPGFLNGDGAKVRIIAPHNQGTQSAAQSVYPTFYEIIISTQKWQW